MKPKISLITLGAVNLEKSLVFYRDGLGFLTHDYKKDQEIVFFELDGTWLSLYPKDKLAKDVAVSTEESGFTSVTLSHNVASPKIVNEVINEAAKAGAKVIKQPQKVFWGGYSGYFSDPDGYLWEVAHNPFMDLT